MKGINLPPKPEHIIVISSAVQKLHPKNTLKCHEYLYVNLQFFALL